MHGRALGLATLLALLFAGACGPSAEETGEEPLETEDIGAPIDAAVTTEFDVRARSSEEIVGASLPDDFPSDLPLCGSGSLVNYGPAGSGRRFVELSVESGRSAVERRCGARLESAGWRSTGEGVFERQGRRISVTYREGSPGTWVRIDYPASE